MMMSGSGYRSAGSRQFKASLDNDAGRANNNTGENSRVRQNDSNLGLGSGDDK